MLFFLLQRNVSKNKLSVHVFCWWTCPSDRGHFTEDVNGTKQVYTIKSFFFFFITDVFFSMRCWLLDKMMSLLGHDVFIRAWLDYYDRYSKLTIKTTVIAINIKSFTDYYALFLILTRDAGLIYIITNMWNHRKQTFHQSTHFKLPVIKKKKKKGWSPFLEKGSAKIHRFCKNILSSEWVNILLSQIKWSDLAQ